MLTPALHTDALSLYQALLHWCLGRVTMVLAADCGHKWITGKGFQILLYALLLFFSE